MFGFSFGELLVLIVVAIVVIGPKDLPKVLRQLGKWAGKLRRMAADMRAQSGIDDVLRSEGLHTDIAEIRKLARGEIEDVMRSARVEPILHEGSKTPAPYQGAQADAISVDREREHPLVGPDAYGALPDTAVVYENTLPASKLADDPLYARGEAP